MTLDLEMVASLDVSRLGLTGPAGPGNLLGEIKHYGVILASTLA